MLMMQIWQYIVDIRQCKNIKIIAVLPHGISKSFFVLKQKEKEIKVDIEKYLPGLVTSPNWQMTILKWVKKLIGMLKDKNEEDE